MAELTWTTPKTDWATTDTFNIEDYNRIKNNINYVFSRVVWAISPGLLDEKNDMGGDITSYAKYWDYEVFNAMESNIGLLAGVVPVVIPNSDLEGWETQTFYPNGAFITAAELNKIESATVGLYENVSYYAAVLHTVPFTLGQYKEVKI